MVKLKTKIYGNSFIHNLSDYDFGFVPMHQPCDSALLFLNGTVTLRVHCLKGQSKLKNPWSKRRKHPCTNCSGSFNITFGSAQMIKSGKVDAVIAIGCVVRGDTPHFDYVCEKNRTRNRSFKHKQPIYRHLRF